MNKLVNLELNGNIVYLNYEHGKYFIKVINSDLVQIAQIEAIDYKSYAIDNDISVDVYIKIENSSILFANKKIIVNDNFLLEMYEDDILVSKDKLNDFCNNREQNELLELEGHSVQDNDHYIFMVSKELKDNDFIYVYSNLVSYNAIYSFDLKNEDYSKSIKLQIYHGVFQEYYDSTNQDFEIFIKRALNFKNNKFMYAFKKASDGNYYFHSSMNVE
jgi:hypothetical protein